MTAYVIAQISIRDRPRYQRYAGSFLPTLAPFEGRLLAADEAVEAMEGGWPWDKVVLIAFPDRARARAWAASPAYAAIAGDRVAATDGAVILADGIGG